MNVAKFRLGRPRGGIAIEPSQLSLIQSLLGVNKAIIEAESSDQVLHVIFDAALDLFAVEACSIALLDAKGDLAFVFSSGAERKGIHVPADQGFGGWVIRRVKPALSNQAASDPRFLDEVDGRKGLETRSIVCVPLKVNRNPIGVIQIVNTKRPRGFQKEDVKILEMFAEMAAAAIRKTEYLQVVRNAGLAYQSEERRRNRLVGFRSPVMKGVIKTARKAAESASTVLLMSESGTGKELVARSIHRWSPRVDGPFVAVNCVALTPELLASELFGHERGAFTGADARKIGKFELADGGAVFLDEIGELSHDLQAKLLRVLQEREFQRVGGNQNLRVDVRIIAATNRDLQREVWEGRFREDLFYRLNVVTIKLPPLRERRDDLHELVQFFLSRYCREMNRPLVQLAPAVEQAIMAYSWPGNVRQLQNTIERAVVLSQGPVVTEEVLPPELYAELPSAVRAEFSAPVASAPAMDDEVPLARALELFQREKVSRALAATGGNQAKAARKLGLQPPNLCRLLKRLGIVPADVARSALHAPPTAAAPPEPAGARD